MTSTEKDVHGLTCDCDRSARYHIARSAFFDRWHRILMMVVIVFGSAALASITRVVGLGNVWTAVVASVAPLAGTIDIVWGRYRKSHDHKFLAHRFYTLAKEIRALDPDPELVQTWHGKILDIYGDEPAVFHALNAECHNAVAQSIGSPDRQEVMPYQHVLRNWVRFSAGDFPPPKKKALKKAPV